MTKPGKAPDQGKLPKLDKLPKLGKAPTSPAVANTDLHPLANVAAAIRAKRESVRVRDGYVELALYVAAVLLIAALAVTQVFLVTTQRGTEMYPAVLDGDIVIGYRLDTNYQKNDVVVCKLDGRQVVTRVVAKGGDSVNITADGKLYVNGTEQTYEINFPTYGAGGNGFGGTDSSQAAQTYPYTVPKDHVFVLGDYRTSATDSRQCGPVKNSDVQAKVVNLVRRRGV